MTLVVGVNLAVFAFYYANKPAYPKIQGTLLITPKKISHFGIEDHHGNPVTETSLKGSWHILSYGYTSCPDICPTTLVELARAMRILEERKQNTNLRILFYSVDPLRDSTERLALYTPYFHPDFIGLRSTEEADDSFSKSLGMVSVIDKNSGTSGDYTVAHGIVLYLLNPLGELQAVLKPSQDKTGAMYFDAIKIATDYLKVREHFKGEFNTEANATNN